MKTVSIRPSARPGTARAAAPRRRLAWRPPFLALLALGLAAPGAISACAEAVLAIELNKLEPRERSCLAYLVFHNQTGRQFDALQLELILFDTDGLILKRFNLDAAPVLPGKTSVKLFEIADIQCDALGRILVNEVVACRGADGPIDGCLELLRLDSRPPVGFFK